MKFETKLNKILSVKDDKLKELKLINLSMSLFPNSPQQLEVLKHLRLS